jgi:hypothetical protein
VSDTMSWYWIVVALLLPLALAMAIAWPFWGRSRDSLGGIVGAFVTLLLAHGWKAAWKTGRSPRSGDVDETSA